MTCIDEVIRTICIDSGQERLSPANTIAAYETIYFPAQRIHLAQDKPRENADVIFENDFVQTV